MAKKESVNILITGVGGQGIILASRIISQAFVEAGYDVKQSEVHGMAQRGGAVSSHIRAGELVYSPLIPYDSADFVLSFEKLEVLRYMPYVCKKSVVLINDQQIDPPSVSAGTQAYPADVVARIKKKAPSVILVPAAQIAAEMGNERMVNTILTGALASYLPISGKIWTKTLQQILPAKILEGNAKAFDQGMKFCATSCGIRKAGKSA